MSLFSKFERALDPDYKYTIWDDIKDWFEYRFHDLRVFKENVVRCCKWAPVIWNSRPWDYGFLMTIMSFQFKQMKEYHLQDGMPFVGQEYVIRQLAEAEELAKRLSDDNFMKKEWDDHHKKYGFGWNLGEQLQTDLGLPVINHSAEVAKQAAREHQELCKREAYLEKQYMDMYCNLIRKKLKRWWS